MPALQPVPSKEGVLVEVTGPYWMWDQFDEAPPPIGLLPCGQVAVAKAAEELFAVAVAVTIWYSLSPDGPWGPAEPVGPGEPAGP